MAGSCAQLLVRRHRSQPSTVHHHHAHSTDEKKDLKNMTTEKCQSYHMHATLHADTARTAIDSTTVSGSAFAAILTFTDLSADGIRTVIEMNGGGDGGGAGVLPEASALLAAICLLNASPSASAAKIAATPASCGAVRSSTGNSKLRRF